MTTLLSPDTKQRFFDNNGNPLVGGLLTTYAAGTTNPIATYKDSTGVATNTNPIVLNARGECDIWLQPNIAYKFALTDAQGNTIPGWPIDNIVNSQLLTLYGGVDTGSVNAYIINFTANFTTLTDGIVIFWIPAHSNTGSSTINVNGLGVVNITNADGSALQASQIIANQPATILYKGGAFILTTAGTLQYSTFTATWNGFSVAPGSTSIPWRKNGSLVTVTLPITSGTSNATSFSLAGLPSTLWPAQFSLVTVACLGMEDNGAYVATASIATISGSTGLITFYKDASHGAWTNSGAKGFLDNSQLTFSI